MLPSSKDAPEPNATAEASTATSAALETQEKKCRSCGVRETCFVCLAIHAPMVPVACEDGGSVHGGAVLLPRVAIETSS